MKKVYILLIVLSVFVFIFYWYEYRPSVIIKDCHEKAIENAQELFKKRAKEHPYLLNGKKAETGTWYLKDDYEAYYKECLRANGLEK